jgi:hypothetical protein
MRLRVDSRTILRILLLGAAVALSAGCNINKLQREIARPEISWATPEEARQTLLAQIKATAGSEALSCGLAPLGSNTADTTSCARKAFSDHQAFWVASELQGDDSELWLVVISNGSGTLRSHMFDSDPMGGGGLRKGNKYAIYGNTSCTRLVVPSTEYPFMRCE